MARNRTWMLHLNLDTFNAVWMTLDTVEERSEFALGMCKGMNNGRQPDTSSDAMIDGFEFGANMRAEAEGYRESRRTIGLLGGNPNLNQKVNHVVKHKDNHVDNAILNPQSLILNPLNTIQEPKITSPTAQSKKLPPAPLEALALFNEHIWKNYPQRARDGKPLNKGHKPDALTRCLYIMGRWGIDWPELQAAVLRYHKHPNVLQGNVQAVEVFFGDRGHWLECWEWVKRQQQEQAK